MAEEKLNTAEDEISLKELIFKLKEWYQYLLSKWKTICIAGLIGGVLGLAYAYFKKPTYTAETTFVLEEGDKAGGIGQYAGLAAMVGIDLGGGSGGVFQGDNILELYKSRKMIQETLLTKDTFNGKKEYLIDRYIEFNHLRDKWENKEELSKITFDTNFSKYSRLQDSVISDLVESINKDNLEVIKPDKKLSIISVKFRSKDELFAKSFTDNIVKNVNDFYVKTKTKKSAENLAILQHQADSIKNVLNSSIAGVAVAVDANPNSNPAFQTLRVPSQKKQVDVQANAAAYQEILKNLEIAKISFRKDQPLIQIIDEPVLPLTSDKKSKLLNTIIGSILFSLLITIGILIRQAYRKVTSLSI
ncbi:Wzz/FepE/Etk N-terminal domain-containing protein [Pelobium sp.]|nr:Wzz/FepE/Etk N-terminal domain-containing protein [Pelobium sp.]MDA9555487.1 Wzz/FepE/Etk N-terminal domain-containing protein [Pelobium sp.]